MSSKTPKSFLLGFWKIEPLSGSVIGPNGETQHLEPKVMEVIVYLADHANEVVTREQLLDVAWRGSVNADEQLTRAISELRRVFHDNPSNPKYIETVRKRGYRLIKDICPVEHGPSDKNVDAARPIAQLDLGKLGLFAVALLAFAVIFVAIEEYSNNPAQEEVIVGEKSIAVLPFVNMSNDAEQEYFADGITEEILNTLAAIDGLQVAGRTSSFTFKNRTDVDLKTIGQLLGVTNVLEGSVRKSGNNLRITVQLIESDSGFHIWSQSYDRELADIFDIQEEIAKAIAGAMQLELGIAVGQSIEERQLDDQNAYETWLLGWSLYRSNAYADALVAFSKVTDMEPEFLAAHRAKVQVYVQMLLSGVIDESAYLEQVQEALQAVTRLDPESDERYLIAGIIHQVHGDFQSAADAFNKGAELSSASWSSLARAVALSLLGERDQVLEIWKDYLVVEPLEHDLRLRYAILLARAGRLAEAEFELAKLVQMAPDDFATIQGKSAYHLFFKNELAEGMKWRMLQNARAPSNPRIGFFVVRALLDLGDDLAAEAWLNSDTALTNSPHLKAMTEYFLARQRSDNDYATALAHDIGEMYQSMVFFDVFIADFDWLRTLQRDNPEFALEIYKRRTPQLVTDSPQVFALNLAEAISLADLYLQTGKTELAYELLDQCLTLLDSHPDHYQRPATIMIYALKGDTQTALKELRDSIDANWRWEWWLLEKDPAYKELWNVPYFKTMMDELRADMVRQRREFAAMIAGGEIEYIPRPNSE